MKSNKGHPFFCSKKNCRKTAWDTPEYLSPEDWKFLKQIALILKDGQHYTFYEFIWKAQYRFLIYDFFNHSIGWPEGWVYCQDRKYVELTGFDCMKKSMLPKIETAIAKKS